jgi:hypothetical protein
MALDAAELVAAVGVGAAAARRGGELGMVWGKREREKGKKGNGRHAVRAQGFCCCGNKVPRQRAPAPTGGKAGWSDDSGPAVLRSARVYLGFSFMRSGTTSISAKRKASSTCVTSLNTNKFRETKFM